MIHHFAAQDIEIPKIHFREQYGSHSGYKGGGVKGKITPLIKKYDNIFIIVIVPTNA